MTMSASAYAASIPIRAHSKLSSAPAPAPVASMGTNAPQGTPAPMLRTRSSPLPSATMSSVAHSGEESTARTPSERLPRSSKNPCPPPIAYAVSMPNAPAARKGKSILPMPRQNVSFANSFLAAKIK